MADDDLNLSAYWNCRYGRGHTKVTRLDQRYDANIFEWNDKLLLWEHTKFHQIDEFRMQKKKSFVNNWENSVGGVKVWNIICTNWKTTKYFSLHLIFVVSPVGQKWDQRAMYLIPFYLWYLVGCVELWCSRISVFGTTVMRTFNRNVIRLYILDSFCADVEVVCNWKLWLFLWLWQERLYDCLATSSTSLSAFVDCSFVHSISENFFNQTIKPND